MKIYSHINFVKNAKLFSVFWGYVIFRRAPPPGAMDRITGRCQLAPAVGVGVGRRSTNSVRAASK